MNSEESSFWKECIPEPNTGCWLWLGPVDAAGEPVASWPGGELPARSVAWKLATDGISAQVRATCGSPLCINPRHLAVERVAALDESEPASAAV